MKPSEYVVGAVASAARPRGVGESSSWITLAIVLLVIVALTFYALRKPGGSGGKGGFGPLGTNSGGHGDDGVGRHSGGMH